MRCTPLTLALGSLLFGCRDDDKPGSDSGSWSMDPVYGVPNLDDDNNDGDPDWDVPDGDESEENDLTALEIPDEVFSAGADLSLSGAFARVWVDGELALEDGGALTIGSNDADSTFEVEFGDFLAEATLTVAVDGGDTQDVRLLAAPLLLNHHLQPAELVMAMSYTGSGGNKAFTDGFADVLGENFTTFSLNQYGWDVWIEDEIEFGTLNSPDHRVDLVIDSIRSGGGQYLDALPEKEFEGPDFISNTWGSGYGSSQDSFGNMEVSPPVTVDGVHYPFGRIYWGEWNNKGPRDEELLAALEAQKVQAPFQVDTTFLCVGHVDEFMTFLPDSSSEKGFKLLINDVPAAYAFLESLDPGLEIPKYSSSHGYDTIGDILADDALRALNEDIQRDYLEPNLQILKDNLGLTEDDVIRLPMLFEESQWCGGDTLSLFPDTVNMTVAHLESTGETHAFLPDPFLREDDSSSDDARAEDVLIAHVEGLLPADVTPHWLDDWDWYHMAWGEVHCGSNTIRTPIDDWWESAQHLIEGGE